MFVLSPPLFWLINASFKISAGQGSKRTAAPLPKRRRRGGRQEFKVSELHNFFVR